jgi:hypothetical protein
MRTLLSGVKSLLLIAVVNHRPNLGPKLLLHASNYRILFGPASGASV